MKFIKSFLLVLTLMFGALLLVGCGEDKKPTGDPDTNKSSLKIEDVQNAVVKAFKDYSDAEHGKVQVVMTKDSSTSTLDLVYNYEEGKYSVISLASVLTSSEGELSCYIDDSKAYINRYNESKTVVKVTEAESESIVSQYGFDAYTKKVKLMLGTSFFKNAKVLSYENDLATIELNIGTYELASDDYDDEDLTTIYDSLKEETSVKLYVNYKDNVATGIKVELVGDVTSTIEVKFLGTSTSDVEIDFPSFEDYK